MSLNPMTPILELRQALIDQISRSYFGFTPNGRPEQRALYGAIRSYLVALVRDGVADEALLQHPSLTAWAFFEFVRTAEPQAADLATQLATASQRSRMRADFAPSPD
jgi:hypothetical protein